MEAQPQDRQKLAGWRNGFINSPARNEHLWPSFYKTQIWVWRRPFRKCCCLRSVMCILCWRRSDPGSHECMQRRLRRAGSFRPSYELNGYLKPKGQVSQWLNTGGFFYFRHSQHFQWYINKTACSMKMLHLNVFWLLLWDLLDGVNLDNLGELLSLT